MFADAAASMRHGGSVRDDGRVRGQVPRELLFCGVRAQARTMKTYTFKPTFVEMYLLLLGECCGSGLRLGVSVLVPAAGLGALVLGPLLGREQTGLEAVLFFALSLLVPATAVLMVLALAFRNFRRLNTLNQSFSEEKIEVWTEFGRTEVLWAGISRARETKRFLKLYVGPTLWVFQPARVLTDPVELAALRALIRKHVPDADLLS